MAASLVIAEVFGPTVQGEGPSCGRRASFLRLGGCNLHCAWCDTGFTWDARRHDLRAELRRVAVADLLAAIGAQGTDLVVITGGEPLLHQLQPGWQSLLSGIRRANVRAEIEIETNGTCLPTAATTRLADRFTVSPKLAHAGDTEAARIRPDVLARFARSPAVFKFVLREPEDLREVDAVVERAGISRDRVWIMPEGTEPDVVLARQRALAGAALARGYNLTTRLHVLLWPSERGR
jgi:7-carboxy-7-deazaguanine synthase